MGKYIFQRCFHMHVYFSIHDQSYSLEHILQVLFTWTVKHSSEVTMTWSKGSFRNWNYFEIASIFCSFYVFAQCLYSDLDHLSLTSSVGVSPVLTLQTATLAFLYHVFLLCLMSNGKTLFIYGVFYIVTSLLSLLCVVSHD